MQATDRFFKDLMQLKFFVTIQHLSNHTFRLGADGSY